MFKLKTSLIVILLLAFKCKGQQEISFKDFGYGEDTLNKSISDSFFSYNELHPKGLEFNVKEINIDSFFAKSSKIDLYSNKKFLLAKKQENYYIYFLGKRKNLNQVFNDDKMLFPNIIPDKLYTLEYNGQLLNLLILKTITSNSFLSRYRGILFFGNSYLKLPDFQTTNSYLNIGDFDCNGSLDYASLNLLDLSDESPKVIFYSLDFNVIKTKELTYHIKLIPLDGYLYKIDWRHTNLPKCLAFERK